MDNLPPQSHSMTNSVLSVAPLHVSSQSSSTIDWTAYMERLVIELSKPNLRENAIRVLSKRKDLFHELAPLLWNSGGTIAVLLQYVYPFLETTNTLPQFDYLRVASLGVIGALVKANCKEVILFLLSTEIIPLCLRSMEIGKELSKNVATFILQKILLDDDGLAYVCATTDRFFAVRRILDMVLESHERQPSTQLLKLIIPCYSRLSQNHSKAGIALTSSLPVVFANPAFINSLREDPTTWRWTEQLYENIRKNHVRSARIEVQMDDIVGSTSLG